MLFRFLFFVLLGAGFVVFGLVRFCSLPFCDVFFFCSFFVFRFGPVRFVSFRSVLFCFVSFRPCTGDLLFFLRVTMLLRGLAARLKVRQKYMDIMAPYAKQVRAWQAGRREDSHTDRKQNVDRRIEKQVGSRANIPTGRQADMLSEDGSTD